MAWSPEAWELSRQLAVELGQIRGEPAVRLISGGRLPEPTQLEREKAMAIVEATAGSAPEIEDGLYPVTCVAVEQTVMENDKFGHKNKLRFKLEIEGAFDGDGEQVYLDPLINEKLSLPDAKMVSTLTIWAGVFGVPIKAGRIDTDDFIGKRAQALIQTEKEGDWPRVKDLLPAKKGQAAPTNGAASAPDTVVFLSVDPKSGEGVIDWTKFWAIAHRHGLNVKHISDAADGKTPDEIDPFELPNILSDLIAKASA